MPTTNPRVQVTLSPSLDALVGALAKHQRTSKSNVLRELLETAEPALRRTVALMQAAEQAAGSLKADLARGLNDAQSRAEAGLAEALGAMDQLTGDLVALAEKVQERRPARTRAAAPHGAARGAAGASDPPASNRGVKSASKGEKGAHRRPVRVPRTPSSPTGGKSAAKSRKGGAR